MINQTLNNRYKVTALLGEGAMGEVYRATDTQTGQEVAVKVITQRVAVDEEMVARFRREGETLRQLRHANIVAFVDMFAVGKQQAIVMEYVPGGSLHSLIQRGPLPIDRALRITLELSDALSRAHLLNIVHRDIKPENVLLAEDGTPKLTDFGVARLLSETHRLTGTGTQMGTPYYMSPEAWEGKTLDEQADIWSLGVMLFEMATGQVPFTGETLVAVMNKVLSTPPPDLKTLRPGVPPALVKIIERMLARDKASRYTSMREVALDVERVMKEGSRSQEIKAAAMKEQEPRAKARRTLPVWAVVAVVVVGVLFGTAVLIGNQFQARQASAQATITALWHAAPATQQTAIRLTDTPLINTATLPPVNIAPPAPTTTPPVPTSTPAAGDLTLYDNFNNSIYDGSFNPALWQETSGGDASGHFQQDGRLTFTQTNRPKDGTALIARRYSDFVLDRPMAFEAKLMLDPKYHPNSQQDSGNIAISLAAHTPAPETWVTYCELAGGDPDQAGIWCHDWWNNGELGTKVMKKGRVNYGAWHTFRIEVDPATLTVTYFINGDLIGSFVPVNADKLKDARFRVTVAIWINSAETITGYVDDVRIYAMTTDVPR
jgi:tRNA A-37 threonylcarbamoyl transferase component Bud32